MRPDYNSPESLAPIIEALLFASDEPLSAQTIRSLIVGEEVVRTDVNEEVATEESVADADAPEGEVEATEGTPAEADSLKKPKRKKRQLIELPTIHAAIEQLNTQLEETARPYRIVAIAGGYHFATRPDYSEYVVRLFKEKSRRRLSGAALETLAIVAYKQPVSKQDIENIRGVNCDEVLKSLLEKNLVTITGRAEAVGRPLLYGTTSDFLKHFGLPSIGDLPKPREIEELMKEEAVKATTLDEAAREFVDPEQLSSGPSIDSAIAEARDQGDDTMIMGVDGISGIELDVDAMSSVDPDEEIEVVPDGLEELDETDLDDIDEVEIHETEINIENDDDLDEEALEDEDLEDELETVDTDEDNDIKGELR